MKSLEDKFSKLFFLGNKPNLNQSVKIGIKGKKKPLPMVKALINLLLTLIVLFIGSITNIENGNPFK